MKNQIVIQIKDVGDGRYDAEIGLTGDEHLLARGIGAALRKEPRFRNIVLEAIDNLVAGYPLKIEDKNPNAMINVEEAKKAD